MRSIIPQNQGGYGNKQECKFASEYPPDEQIRIHLGYVVTCMSAEEAMHFARDLMLAVLMAHSHDLAKVQEQKRELETKVQALEEAQKKAAEFALLGHEEKQEEPS
jgi:hypothetical protein